MSYRLSRCADQELLSAIYQESAERFGVDQAERYVAGLRDIFDVLANFPQTARERPEVRRSIRAHPYKAHLIVYRIEGEDIFIVRLPHGRSDWIGDAS